MLKFITENKDYQLVFNKKKSIFNNNNYIYNCIIYNNLNIEILSFNFTEIDLLNIIDNMNEFLSEDINLYYSISNCNSNIYIIELSQSDIDVFYINKIEDYYTKDYLSIYSYINGNYIKILSFEVTHSLNELLELLLIVFQKFKPR